MLLKIYDNVWTNNHSEEAMYSTCYEMFAGAWAASFNGRGLGKLRLEVQDT